MAIFKSGIISVLIFIGFQIFSQSYIEPSKLKQFNITVNFPDYTVKTQMLSHNKDIQLKSELSYMWYSSQKIMETKGGYDGKLIHGIYRSFYLNNQLKEKGQVKYGLRHKVWTYWYSNGNIKESITWKNGTKNGTYCIYNDDGKLMAKSKFKDDKLNGFFYTYDANGKVIEKKKYKNGIEVIKKQKRSKKDSDIKTPKKKLKEKIEKKESDSKTKKQRRPKKEKDNTVKESNQVI